MSEYFDGYIRARYSLPAESDSEIYMTGYRLGLEHKKWRLEHDLSERPLKKIET